MTANPLQLQPVILEMTEASAPFSSGSNLTLAQQAVSILQANGQVVGALPILGGAAGYANAVGILAMSLLPQVATIDQDAVVRARRPSYSGPPWPPGKLTSLYPKEVNANRVWQQGGTGRGVTVAVLDSGVAADVDLTQAGNRIVASASFAGLRDPTHPDAAGHATHIARTTARDRTRSARPLIGMGAQAHL